MIWESGTKLLSTAEASGNQVASFWRRTALATLSSGWFWLILSGYVLRLAVAPFAGQHDVLFMPWQAHFITQGHLNLYAYLYDQFGDVVLRRPGVWAPYPYGFYALTATWWWLLDKLQLVDLTGWQSIWQVEYPARYIFLQKLTYLPFDLAVGVIFLRAFPGNRGRLAWVLWAWAPMAIYTPWLMGQNDLYATAFMTAAIYAAGRAGEIAGQFPNVGDKRRTVLFWSAGSAALLGIGATFKVFPLLLLPVLALFVSRRWLARLGYVIVGGGIFGMVVLPFIPSQAFREGVLFNREGLQLFNLTDFLGVQLPLFWIGYLGLLGWLLVRRQERFLPLMQGEAKNADAKPSSSSGFAGAKSKWSSTGYLPIWEQVWSASLVVFGCLFLFVPGPIYWWIWILPLVIAVACRRRWGIFAWSALQVGFAILLLDQHRELGIGLPVHLSNQFDIPNLKTIFTLRTFEFLPLLDGVMTLADLLMKAVLLIFVAWSVIDLYGRSRVDRGGEDAPAFGDQKSPGAGERLKPASVLLIFLPMIVLWGGLAINLWLGRELVADSQMLTWQRLRLSKEHPTMRQEISPVQISSNLETQSTPQLLNGFRLQWLDASDSAAALQVCIYNQGELIICQMEPLQKFVDGNLLYFLFDSPVVLPEDGAVVEVRLLTLDETVDLGISKPQELKVSDHLPDVIRNNQVLSGVTSIFGLHNFKADEVFHTLVVKNILHDLVIWCLMLIAILVCAAVIIWALGSC